MTSRHAPSLESPPLAEVDWTAAADAAQSTRPPHWYRLDNAGKIFSSVITSRLSTLFRLSATLREPVHVGRLQRAVDRLAPRFPYLMVQMRPGLFWYYFDDNGGPPRVEPDSRQPCVSYRRRRGAHLIRVRAFHRRIAVEFAHALTDGTGGLTYLRSLLAEYARQGGVEVPCGDGILDPEEQAPEEEFENAFTRFFHPDIPSPAPLERAFRMPVASERAGLYRVTTGVLSASDVVRRSKELGVSVGELLTAVYLDAFQRVFESLPLRRRRHQGPIRIDLPVNLRQHFPSKTMRNFFLPVHPWIDPRLGHYTLEEILHKVHHFMRHDVDAKLLSQQLARNVRSERHPLARLTPLFLKNLVLTRVYREFSQHRTTSGFSNLGRVGLPPPLESLVERFDFLPAPGLRRVNCGVISLGERLCVTFGRTYASPVVERHFFRHLARLGVRIRVETNH